ncbi:hypothetical protein V5F59_07525 [Xanthobacter autotrophicus DSM 431]
MHLTQGSFERHSCWGVARKALAFFLVAVALIYLFGGFDPSVVRPA